MRLEIIVFLLFSIYVDCQRNSTKKTIQATGRTSSSSNKLDFERVSVFPKKSAYLSNSKKLSQSKAKSNKILNLTRRIIPISKGIDQIKSIYNHFKNGNAVLNDKSINTVRYIPSVKVDTTKKLYFLFNLSLLSGSEMVVKADLFINRKYIKQGLEFNIHYFWFSSGTKRNSSSTIQKVNKYTSAGGTSSSANIFLKNLKQDKFSKQYTWQSFNIIDSVKSYLSIRNSQKLFKNDVNNMLDRNVYFTYNNNAEIRSSLDELVLIMETTNYKPNSKNIAEILNPYLIVYSEEKEINMRKFFQSRMPNIVLDSTSSISDDSALYKTNEDEIIQLKNFENQVDKQNESFDSNEKTENKTTISLYVSGLDLSKKSNISLNSTNKLSSIENYLIENSKENDPYFNYMLRSKRDLKAKRFSPANEENDISRSFLEESNSFRQKMYLNLKENINTKCSKQSITIDFDDFGLSDWIVEPIRFSSSYCSGSCKFPLDQKLSNYATLQKILNSIGLNSRNTPPELCCSPSITKSLPILYMDKNSIDYVVKILPDMVVKDCSCR